MRCSAASASRSRRGPISAPSPSSRKNQPPWQRPHKSRPVRGTTQSRSSRTMKITNVELIPFRRPLGGKAAEVMIKGQSLLPHITEFVAIRISTDEGVTGESLSLGGGLGMAHYLRSEEHTSELQSL